MSFERIAFAGALVALVVLTVLGCARPRSGALVGTGGIGSSGGATGAGTGGTSVPPRDADGSDSGLPSDSAAGVDMNVIDAPTDVNDAPTDVNDAPTDVNDAPTNVSDASIDMDAAPALPFLTLAPASGSSTMFGVANVGDTVTKTFAVANPGAQPSSAVAVTLSTPAASGFYLPQATTGGCVSGTTTLPPGGTCTIAVRFSPTTIGTAAATLAVTATVGGSPEPLALSGSGGKAILLATINRISLGTIEVGKSKTGSVTVTNDGTVATGVPTLMNGNTAELMIVTNTCTAALAPGENCTVSFTLRPLEAGDRSAIFTLSATPGGTTTVTVTGSGA